MMKTITRWIRRTTLDALDLISGQPQTGLPGGLVGYDTRLRWFHDRHGNEWCVSVKCYACGARRSIVFPIRRMGFHVARVHKN
jgi:hypothetical protein